MNPPLGVGIIGGGMIANFHARALKDAAGVRPVGVTARRFEAARKFAEEHDLRAHESLDAMLADDAIDVVTICTPSGAHRDPAVAAADAGKHVVVEKPLEITTARCDEIIAACERNNVRLSVTFQSRFHGAARAIKDAVDAGRFGRLTLGDAIVKWYRPQSYYDSGAWRGTWDLDGGGALMNQAIHSVDLLLWLMGDVAEVSAMTATLAHERIEVEDAAVATLRFTNGALGTIVATTAAHPGTLKRVEISGDAGTAILEEEDLKLFQFADEHPDDDATRDRFNAATKTGGGASDPSAIGHHGHAALFEEVAASIRENRPSILDGHQGRRSVELIEAIYRSAKDAAPVSLRAD